jgi:hypothetical protein
MPSNIERANRARIALDAYTAQDGQAYAREDIETRVRDLICDLLHLATAEIVTSDQPVSVEERIMGAALMNNLEERDEDEPAPLWSDAALAAREDGQCVALVDGRTATWTLEADHTGRMPRGVKGWALRCDDCRELIERPATYCNCGD